MARDPRYQRLLNSRRWKELRVEMLRREPLCQECKREGYVRSSVDCHHIRPISSAMTVQEMERLCFDPNNIPEIIDCGPMKLGRHYAAEMLDLEPYKDIAGYTGPVLIVHGTADVIVNVEYAKKAAEAYEATAADRLTLVIIPEGAHGFMKEHDAIATAAVAKFAAL